MVQYAGSSLSESSRVFGVLGSLVISASFRTPAGSAWVSSPEHVWLPPSPRYLGGCTQGLSGLLGPRGPTQPTAPACFWATVKECGRLRRTIRRPHLQRRTGGAPRGMGPRGAVRR